MRNSRACKLYDFDRGMWMTYHDAMTWLVAAPTDAADARGRLTKGTMVR